MKAQIIQPSIYKRPHKRSARRAQHLAAQKSWGRSIWILLGILVGILGCALVMRPELILPMLAPKLIASKAAVQQHKPSASPKATPHRAPRPAKAHFDFYTILTKNETEAQPRTSPAQTPLKTLPALATTPPAVIPPSPVPKRYSIQTGAFKHYSDADAFKAELTLQGFNAKIQKATLSNGKPEFHVILGPFPTEQAAQHYKKQLQSFDIPVTLIRH